MVPIHFRHTYALSHLWNLFLMEGNWSYQFLHTFALSNLWNLIIMQGNWSCQFLHTFALCLYWPIFGTSSPRKVTGLASSYTPSRSHLVPMLAYLWNLTTTQG